jgi:hypothetical protein
MRAEGPEPRHETLSRLECGEVEALPSDGVANLIREAHKIQFLNSWPKKKVYE